MGFIHLTANIASITSPVSKFAEFDSFLGGTKEAICCNVYDGFLWFLSHRRGSGQKRGFGRGCSAI